VKILYLTIENFLTIGLAELRLSDTGLVLIQGKNEDEPSAVSNGAGKSSIPDALMWVLFGETARGVSGDAVINQKVKKNAHVSAVIQDGDSIYRIDRHRKHDTQKNNLLVNVWNPAETYPLGRPTDLTRGTERETQALIAEILGCSKEVFSASIYAGQEAMPDLPRMTDKQLKVLIEEAAGVERLERAYEIARSKVQDAEVLFGHTHTTILRDEAALADLQVRLDGLKKQHADFEAGRAGREASHKGVAAGLDLEIRNLQEKVAASGESALHVRRGEITGALAEHSKVLAKHAELARAHVEAQRVCDQAGHAFATAREEINRVKQHIEQAPGNVGKPCRTCNKPHTQDDLAAVLANLNAELKTLATRAVELKQDYVEKVDVAGEAKKVADEFAKTIPGVSALTIEQALIDTRLREVEGMRNQIALKQRDLEAANQRAVAVMGEPNPYISAMKAIVQQAVEVKTRMTEAKSKIKELERALDIATLVMKVFSPAGVRAHILDTVTPFLNERTAEYLSALSDGNLTAVWSTLTTTAKGEPKEKFNIDCENATGAKSFGGLSGGEKRKVRLATMLALQDLVASRATKPIDLWIGDEVDDALDPAGLERLMGILEQKARERGSVLVISHNELSDWADSICTVTKRGGISKAEGALVA
jgi:DNA repair exonuclease SbcCD ATPase subunit